MSDFAEWIRKWEESGRVKRLSYTEDLANLCAQQHEDLVEHGCTGMCYEGYQYEVQVCKRGATLKAVEDFMEKYR